MWTFTILPKTEAHRVSELRLHEGELNIMELLWSNKTLAAKDMAKIIKEYVGWEKNTTYTVIKRLIDKGAIVREDPGFICKATVSKRMVQQMETLNLINKFYGGSFESFIAEYLRSQDLSAVELDLLEKIVKEQRV
jgi:predicted transcriptional regulator